MLVALSAFHLVAQVCISPGFMALGIVTKMP
jgi:hypothetical protein